MFFQFIGRFFVTIFLTVTVCTGFFFVAQSHAACEVNGPDGKWVFVEHQEPQAWDGVFIATNIIGNYKYQVDWCGAPCNRNCRGTTPAYGTSFTWSGVQECWAESARIWQWQCDRQNQPNNGPGKACPMEPVG